jgi:enamine deaminase RidA (YjgF/YER057c/UK114 family)
MSGSLSSVSVLAILSPLGRLVERARNISNNPLSQALYTGRTDEFGQSPLVINGFSLVFVDLLGNDLGIGARSALGTNSLPNGMAVEVEAIFEIKPLAE